VAGASVSVVDSDAATTDPQPVAAAADGSFTVDVTGLKPPFAVKASGSMQGAAVELFAIVPGVEAQQANTVNVTPLTHAVAALVAPGGDPAALASAAALAANVTAQKTADATKLVVDTLRSDAAIAGALGTGFDPLRTPFKADGGGVDGVLDKLEVTVAPGSGVEIRNLAAATPADPPAPVKLQPGMTAAPPLPASGEVPTAAELAALGAKIEACWALPIAQRVTTDADGHVTDVLGACRFTPDDWRSQGRSFKEEVGQNILTKSWVTGTRAGRGQVVLALPPLQLTEAKVVKHPTCNDNPCVVVRWPMTTPSNRTFQSEWVLGRTAGGWNFVGNQSPYRVFVEPRLNRYTAANPAGAAAGNNTPAYFFADRFESQLRLNFDPSANRAAADAVRAVRFKGPGLPQNGVVLVRSQQCGTDDRFAIANQTGSTMVNTPPVFQFWTGGSGNDYVLDAATPAGAPLAMPQPAVNFSPQPVANQSSLIPAFAIYRVEIFKFSPLSEEPDEVVLVRTSAAAENAAAGAGKPWPTLAPAFVADHLAPGGTKAGSIDALAGQSISWTVPSGLWVGSAYLFGRNSAQATNAQNEFASFGARTRIDYEPVAFGDTTAPAVRFATTASSASLSTFSTNAGTNPNPRCAGLAGLLPLTPDINDYREAGLSFRNAADRKLYNAIWFWDN
jgi:glucoamylase